MLQDLEGELEEDVVVELVRDQEAEVMSDLGRRFLATQIEVVLALADFVTVQTAAQCRRSLPDLQIIRLRLPLHAARRRAQVCPVRLTEQEFDTLDSLDMGNTFPVDHVVDVAGLDPRRQVDTG
jgi:hypothetical protein